MSPTTRQSPGALFRAIAMATFSLALAMAPAPSVAAAAGPTAGEKKSKKAKPGVKKAGSKGKKGKPGVDAPGPTTAPAGAPGGDAASTAKVIFFNVEGSSLPEELELGPTMLSRLVEGSLAKAGYDVVKPKLMLVDAMALSDCTELDGFCAYEIGSRMAADYIFVGELAGASGVVKATLRLWNVPASELEREVVETLDPSFAKVTAAFEPLAARVAGLPVPEPGDIKPVEPDPVTPIAVPPTPAPAPVAGSRISPLVLAGGGVAICGLILAGVSLPFYFQAVATHDDFENVGRDTAADFDEAERLRNRGRTSSTLTVAFFASGGTLILAGAALLAVGLVSGGKEKKRKATSVMVGGFASAEGGFVSVRLTLPEGAP